MNAANCCDIGVRESIDGKFSFFLTTSDSCFEGKIYIKKCSILILLLFGTNVDMKMKDDGRKFPYSDVSRIMYESRRQSWLLSDLI